MSTITTKAAVCPNCKGFHLIASISSFNENKETRKEFAEMMKAGFQIIEVSTAVAKERFNYCENEPVKKQLIQTQLF